MKKQQILDLLMLLSALESWSFSAGKTLPDYLHENLTNAVDNLAKGILQDDAPNVEITSRRAE